VSAWEFSALFYDLVCDGEKLKQRHRLFCAQMINFVWNHPRVWFLTQLLYKKQSNTHYEYTSLMDYTLHNFYKST
jgi:hypothetical protein